MLKTLDKFELMNEKNTCQVFKWRHQANVKGFSYFPKVSGIAFTKIEISLF